MLFSKKWNLKTSNCRLLFHKKLDRSSTQKWHGFWCALCSIFHKKTTYTSFTQFRISNSPLPVLYKYFKHFTRLNVSPICRKSCNIKCSELISILLFKKKKKIQAHSEQHSKHNFQVQVQPRFVSYTHSKNNWITITRFHWNDNTVNK